MKQLMYLNHFDIRPCRAQYLFWYYYMLERFPEAYYILNRDYVNPGNKRWEIGIFSEEVRNSVKKCKVMDRFNEVHETRSIKAPSQVLETAVYRDVPSITNSLLDTMREEEIEVALTCCNNKSLETACREFGIPCIHNEQGPLRQPFFRSCVYFDFSGVNGNTEFTKRFQDFLLVSDKVKILSKEELLQVISMPGKYKELKSLIKEKPTYECGVAMQVDIDTNLLAYNRGISQVDLLNMAIRKHGKVIVRNHPLSSTGYVGPASLSPSEIDKSANSLEFVSKCKKIWTINSSVGFEALLMDREVEVEGESFFREIPKMDKETQLKALNFAIFSYLVLPECYDSMDYHEFRVDCKDEVTLYNEGQKYWLKQ